MDRQKQKKIGGTILDRVSYHAVYDTSILDALAYAHQNGFAGIQVAIETPHLSFELLSESQIQEIADYAASHDLYISIHAPDEAVSLFQSSRHLQAGIMQYYEALFSFAEAVSARILAIHAGAMSRFSTDTVPELEFPEEDLPLYQGTFRRNLEEIVRLADGRFMLCVENYAIDRVALDLLTPYLERGDLFLCWDLAKGIGRPELEDFFFGNLPWVKQVHLHDLKHRSHRTIGSGEIDFSRYLGVLKDADVEDFCIEVRPREKAKESLETLKALLNQLDPESGAPP